MVVQSDYVFWIQILKKFYYCNQFLQEKHRRCEAVFNKLLRGAKTSGLRYEAICVGLDWEASPTNSGLFCDVNLISHSQFLLDY